LRISSIIGGLLALCVDNLFLGFRRCQHQHSNLAVALNCFGKLRSIHARRTPAATDGQPLGSENFDYNWIVSLDEFPDGLLIVEAKDVSGVGLGIVIERGEFIASRCLIVKASEMLVRGFRHRHEVRC
jgi:hypothetical protein